MASLLVSSFIDAAEFLSQRAGSRYAALYWLVTAQFGMHRRKKALLLVCVAGVACVLWFSAPPLGPTIGDHRVPNNRGESTAGVISFDINSQDVYSANDRGNDIAVGLQKIHKGRTTATVVKEQPVSRTMPSRAIFSVQREQEEYINQKNNSSRNIMLQALPNAPSENSSLQDSKAPSQSANRGLGRPTVTSEAERFDLQQPFSLPQPKGSKNLEPLMQSEWMGQLKAFLETVSSGPVTLVSSDYGYREVLLNWLISATVRVAKPLSNILALSLDASLYHLLINRSIPCVHVSPEAILRLSLKLPEGHMAFTQVHIMRLTVMRLINHWGFDVANYDTDALILKNPEQLYYTGSLRDRDFIGSYGHFPLQQLKDWGVAVCIGVVFIRSTPQTELYWEAMNKVDPKHLNDQVRLNAALQAMDVHSESDRSTLRIAKDKWLGRGRDGFSVAVLPTSVVCRTKTCVRKRKSQYHIWHKGGERSSESKMKYASQGGLWFLRTDWEAVGNTTMTTGQEWLKEIAVI